jgi:hypothetical protein
MEAAPGRGKPSRLLPWSRTDKPRWGGSFGQGSGGSGGGAAVLDSNYSGQVWGSGRGVREWPERLQVGGADKVWLFFVCLCPSKEMKPIFYKQILHPNIKKIVYE